MALKKLEQDLESLREALGRIPPDDQDTRAQLQQHIEDIEKKLEHPEDEQHHHDLVEGLKKSIARFEADHPRATAILNDIMVTLSNMGI